MFETGDTTLSQMTRRDLALRFLMRTRCEVEQMRAWLPDTQLPIEPPSMQQMERMAASISSAAEVHGFPEIGVIAGAIELLSQVASGRSTFRERLELATRLAAQLSALEVHLEYELAERESRNGQGTVVPNRSPASRR